MLSIVRKKIISMALACSIAVTYCSVQAFSLSSLFSKKTKEATQVATSAKKWSMGKIIGGVCAVVLISVIAYWLKGMGANAGDDPDSGPSGACETEAKDDFDNIDKLDIGKMPIYSEKEKIALKDLKEACKIGNLEQVQKTMGRLCDDMENSNTHIVNANILERHLFHIGGSDAPLYVACKNGFVEIVKYIINFVKSEKTFGSLVNFGRHTNFGDYEDESIFDVAWGNDEIFKFLARVGFDGTTKYYVSGYKKGTLRYEKSPLHTACEKNKFTLVQWLVEELKYDNADVKEAMSRKTPLDIAKEKGYADIVEYLVSCEKKSEIKPKKE